jgi:Glycosyltransferase family 87
MVCRRVGLGLPYSFAYYYVPGNMFQDFYSFHDKFRMWGTPAFFAPRPFGYFMYPAPLVHVFRFLLGLHHAQSCFLCLLLTIAGGLAVGFARALRRTGLGSVESAFFAGATALLSYPLVLLLQRWNIEVVVWLVGTLGVWCFLTGRTNAAAVFFGVAASLKLYPIIFLGLLLPRRRYGGFLLGVATFAGVTLLSLYGIGPTVGAAARWDGEQIAAFTKYYVGDIWALGYDHSFFALVKAATLHWRPNYFLWARPYSIVVAVVSVGLYFGRLWGLPVTNQVLALSILSVTLAPVSYDYTLLNLYGAFAMLAVVALQAQRRGREARHLTAYMTLFALVFTPESYVIVQGARYGAQVRTVCLIGMLMLAHKTPLPEMEAARNDEVEDVCLCAESTACGAPLPAFAIDCS